MQCANCQHDNREGAKFCGQCGASLERICPQCEHQNESGARFCDECGTSLDAAVESTPIAPTEPRPTEAERRQLTVMFCDLVGSTLLSEQLDPEELREVLRDYQSVCAKVIARFEGHIAQYLGDGILVYFGYPQAHEDAAQRAIRSGIGILEAMEGLNARLQQESDVRLAVRVGIHTGLVVVGEIGEGERTEQLALGHTPNIAARLEALAEPNTLIISDATYQLIEGFFDCEDLGRQSLPLFMEWTSG